MLLLFVFCFHAYVKNFLFSFSILSASMQSSMLASISAVRSEIELSSKNLFSPAVSGENIVAQKL